jgi:predicted nucleic acid-binding protein
MSVPQSLDIRRLFVDTSAFYAMMDRRSREHGRSIAVHETLIAEQRHLFTTNFVLAEIHALLLNRHGRTSAAQALEWIDRSTVELVRVSEADELRAREIIFSHIDKDYSYTDATSFAVMERLHIGAAFAFDRHFAQYGFAVLGLEGA